MRRRTVLVAFAAAIALGAGTASAMPRTIEGSAPQLHPEGVAWDATRNAFLVSSVAHGTVSIVKPNGQVSPLARIPVQASTVGLKVDLRRNRVLVAYSNNFDATVRSGLAIFDLTTGRQLHVVDLADDAGPHRANDVTVDPWGNAYVSDTVSDRIYRVDVAGHASVFARDPRLGGELGNNGLAWHPGGYLVVGHYTTGKLFKVTRDSVSEVAVQPLVGADGIAFRPDGTLLVVTNTLESKGRNSVFSVRSRDGWASARVVAEKAWPTTSPTTITVSPFSSYVVTGYIDKLLAGTPVDEFRLDRL
ncbi:gluconolaconase [Lentzea sp. NBRC 105346]|uniref:SMP-30/gluconolactonase/LRE family protein n=1 Tax=Lentzea sp. NBRC 105346 TaxID=3032205 RepID=UPI00249FC2F6|nr:SMP-30/gluconolactonase/LRE family protein [Lentzea sp. NBRC 105346]GLZ34728.1 gluconolaconase [Lentzea sp. NBRC 105346]